VIARETSASTTASTAQSERAPIVYVTGGKGGVGKTLVAAHLCAALAREKARVLLVDLDLGMADGDVLLQHCSALGLLDALRDNMDLAQCVAPTAHGFDLLAGIAGESEWAALGEARRNRLVDGLRALATSYDVIVADGSPGIGEDVLAFAAAADRVLLVTTPDALALADAYGLIKALHQRSEAASPEIPTPEVLVNRARDLAEAEFTAARLRSVSERFLARSPRWAGWVPESRTLARSFRRSRTSVDEPDATWGTCAASCLAQLARRLKPARQRALSAPITASTHTR
jgi:flagellar biosynthesis protein FlhG